jgi:hypothetical protein
MPNTISAGAVALPLLLELIALLLLESKRTTAGSLGVDELFGLLSQTPTCRKAAPMRNSGNIAGFGKLARTGYLL